MSSLILFSVTPSREDWRHDKRGDSISEWHRLSSYIKYDFRMLWIIQRPRVQFQKGDTARHPVLAHPKVSINCPDRQGGLALIYLQLWVFVLQLRVLKP